MWSSYKKEAKGDVGVEMDIGKVLPKTKEPPELEQAGNESPPGLPQGLCS